MLTAKIKFKPKSPSIRCLNHRNPSEMPSSQEEQWAHSEYKQKVTFYDLWLGQQ